MDSPLALFFFFFYDMDVAAATLEGFYGNQLWTRSSLQHRPHTTIIHSHAYYRSTYWRTCRTRSRRWPMRRMSRTSMRAETASGPCYSRLRSAYGNAGARRISCCASAPTQDWAAIRPPAWAILALTARATAESVFASSLTNHRCSLSIHFYDTGHTWVSKCWTSARVDYVAP